MKKILLILLALVLVVGLGVLCLPRDYDVEVDGIYYNIDKEAKQATVTYREEPRDKYLYGDGEAAYYVTPSDLYSGDVMIPSTIMVGGVEYSVTSIGRQAFYDCSSLTSIVIPSSVTSIGLETFYDCSSLTSIVIPSSVTRIGLWAFAGCSSLTSIEIPSSVTSIGQGAFTGCSSLTSIEIPSSVTSIGADAFSCGSLISIKVDTDNPIYDSREDCNAIIETASNRLIAGCKNTEIPSSVTSIGLWAFVDCSSLTSIEIPSSVTNIGDWAFVGCSSLTSIEIPSSVTTIREMAFAYCENLENVYFYATELPKLVDTDQFINSNIEHATLHVPSAVIDDFKATEPWSKFGKIVPIDEMYQELTNRKN